MEAAALNGPPARLERLVLLLIPPAAREAVAGDLWEMYRSPAQYAREALRTVPFVIASQMRRNANLPLLGLQGFLVFFCFGGFAGPIAWSYAAVPTGVVLLALLLRAAYQPVARPSPRRAIREAVLVAFCVVLFSEPLTAGAAIARHLSPDWFAWTRLSFIGPVLLPVLCFYRASLILEGDRRPHFAAGTASPDTVVGDYHRFARRIRRRNSVEAGALVIAAALATAFLRAGMPHAWLVLALVCVYPLVAFYLLAGRPEPHLPENADFLSLRAQYQRELAHQQQLRRFLWWLWLAPVLVTLHAALIEDGFTARRPLMIVFGSAVTLLLCFCIGVLNREHDGQVQEKIGLLDRMGEENA